MRQWSVAERKPLADWVAHADSIYALALSKDGKQLATAGGDEVATVWALADRKPRATLEGHQGAVYGLAFKSDGDQLATVSADHHAGVGFENQAEDDRGARAQGRGDGARLDAG